LILNDLSDLGVSDQFRRTFCSIGFVDLDLRDIRRILQTGRAAFNRAQIYREIAVAPFIFMDWP
jgi:hypothetical protein